MRKFKYLLSLDLSSTQSGYAIFQLDSNSLLASGVVKKKGQKGLIDYYDNNNYNESYITKGVFLRDLMIQDLAEMIDNEGYGLNGNNTLLVIEKRLSGFSKFSTNKTIETIAQLSQSALLLFAGKKKMTVFHVPVLTWQNKLFGNKQKRNGVDTKELSKQFVQLQYNVEVKSNDESDAICIGHYYINHCIFKDLDNSNVQKQLYKNFVSTKKEAFEIIYNAEKMRKIKTNLNNFDNDVDNFVDYAYIIDGKEPKCKTLFFD